MPIRAADDYGFIKRRMQVIRGEEPVTHPGTWCGECGTHETHAPNCTRRNPADQKIVGEYTAAIDTAYPNESAETA